MDLNMDLDKREKTHGRVCVREREERAIKRERERERERWMDGWMIHDNQ